MEMIEVHLLVATRGYSQLAARMPRGRTTRWARWAHGLGSPGNSDRQKAEERFSMISSYKREDFVVPRWSFSALVQRKFVSFAKGPALYHSIRSLYDHYTLALPTQQLIIADDVYGRHLLLKFLYRLVSVRPVRRQIWQRSPYTCLMEWLQPKMSSQMGDGLGRRGSKDNKDSSSFRNETNLEGSLNDYSGQQSPRSASLTRFAWVTLCSSFLLAVLQSALDSTITANLQPTILNTFGEISKFPGLNVTYNLGMGSTCLLC